MIRTDLTFVIIAQNEEINIGRAIESCRDLGGILVVDGGSVDRTPQIASALGAKVLENPFRYAAQQYNFGLDNVETPWAFILDSDERLGTEARAAIARLAPGDCAAYEMDRLNYFCGRPVRHSGWSPDWSVRLFRVDSARYDDRAVHARVDVRGRTGRLGGRIHHMSYTSVSQYVAKLNSYTSFEVEARAGQQRVVDSRSRLRRAFLKLPMKSAVRFVYMYIMRRGYLDGQVGLELAFLSSFYERIVTYKSRHDTSAASREPIYLE